MKLATIREFFQRPIVLEKTLEIIHLQGKLIMATLADVQTAQAAQTVAIGSAVSLLVALKAKVDAGGAVTPADLDGVVSAINSATQQLNEAVTANTPAG